MLFAKKYNASQPYLALLNHIRQPIFYERCRIPDNFAGRFELMVLHLFAYFYRLKSISRESNNFKKGRVIGQEVFDLFFMDCDHMFRKAGLNDRKIGRLMKDYMRAFYGRLLAYEAHYKEISQLVPVLKRNIDFGGCQAIPYEVLASYVQELVGCFNFYEAEDLMQARFEGHLPFPKILGGSYEEFE